MGERIYSIDALRAVAIAFVIVAHAKPFAGMGARGNLLYFVLDTIGQFDVQFFFVTSGYFLATKLSPSVSGRYVVGTIRKLGSLYLFGILFALAVHIPIRAVGGMLDGRSLAFGAVRAVSELARRSPLDFVYYGDAVAVHLWYLTALAFAICFVAGFVAIGGERYLFPTAAALHVVGVLTQNYETVFSVPVPTRDALFFGFFYVALGYTIRSVDWSPSADRSRAYLGAFGVLLAAQLAEQYFVAAVVHDVPFSAGFYTTEYTFVTPFLVAALFGWALATPEWGKGTPLPTLGTYAVGVYLLHYPLKNLLVESVELLQSATGVAILDSLLWNVSVVPLLYVLSLGLYLLAARLGVIDPDGSHLPRVSRMREKLFGSPSN
ncbi:acyltransferase [Candidatus Halobonum tyrrellensis]|uniref:acyltransferase n=1 Tax=Candidatus Halobonum tyrrellensis TaxID=1431545 RepID=UPI00190F2EEE|nr:acyltransferase [Candidatus Halobonum tyrrellensis]